MMRWLKYIGLATLAVMVLFGIIGLFLPYDKHIERQITIKAPANIVFAYLNDFRKFNQWSPWAKIDPETRYTYNSVDSGLSAAMQWSSNHEYVGKGSQEILESQPFSYVKTRLEFAFMEPAATSFSLQETQGQTTVVWTFDIYMSNTIFRFSGWLLDSWDWVGTTYELGLLDLKTLIENR